jgi:hypothetical protein
MWLNQRNISRYYVLGTNSADAQRMHPSEIRGKGLWNHIVSSWGHTRTVNQIIRYYSDMMGKNQNNPYIEKIDVNNMANSHHIDPHHEFGVRSSGTI